MTRYLLAGAAALGLMSSAAMAQTWTSQTTAAQAASTDIPTVNAPANVKRIVGKEVTPDGVQTLSNEAIARDSHGDYAGIMNSSTAYPLSSVIATTTKKLRTINGVPTEVVTTTYAYPPRADGTATLPPVTTTYQVVRNDLK